MRALELIAQLELALVQLAEAPVKDVDPLEARETVEALEQLRRSLTFVIETWRASEVVILGAAGGKTMVAPNAVASVRPKRRDRYDHDLIGRYVIRRAVREVDAEGEVLFDVDDPTTAADRAVAWMRKLYVAEATEPKSGALKELGFETKFGAMASSKIVGQEVKVRPK